MNEGGGGGRGGSGMGKAHVEVVSGWSQVGSGWS